jgi:hypothetical protein
MNKRILVALTALSLLGIVAVISVQAEVPLVVKANIPFSFVFEGGTFPAGFYYVEAHPLIQDAVQIRDSSGRVLATALAQTVHSRSNQKGAELVFRRYGNVNVLSEILPGDGLAGRELVYSRLSHGLAANMGEPATVVVAAQAK